MEKDRSNLKMAVDRLKEIENTMKNLNDELQNFEKGLQKLFLDNPEIALSCDSKLKPIFV